MNRTTVEEIKARIPIEELISSYVKIEKSGRSYKARCPFHNEKTASFFISPDRGGYYCFGCAAKGDIFSFVEQFEGLDFKGALKVLAEKAGVPLIVDQKTDSDKDKLFKITEETAKYFEDQYSKSKEAQDYVKGRGINPETRASFRIGWAPEGWHNLLNHLKKNGWNETIIEKAGFIKAKDPASVNPKNASLSKYYDRFRGRVVFPITDSSGRVVAFTGRILKDDGVSAKYLNSPETPLFNKSQTLFGLDKAKSEIRRVGYSVLVEGQMDLVLSHQVGVKNAIAASGTALTDQSKGENGVVSNLGMVRRLSSNMIIALDSDKAGRTAAMRAVAATALSMGMSVKIAEIEGGKDPADLIMANPELWKNTLKNAKHVIEFELGNVMKEVPDAHKLGKAVRDRVFPFLARIDSEMDKAYFMKTIAEQTHLNEQAVWEDLRKFEKMAKQATASNTSNQAVGASSNQSVSNNSNNAGNTTSNNAVNSSSKYSSSASSNAGSSKTLDSSKFSQTPINNNNNNNNSNFSTGTNAGIKPHRLDLVERRMFGLLSLMDSVTLPAAKEYRERIKKIAGESYEERLSRITPVLDDLSFEAESLYGDKQDIWNVHMNELIFNFEEDLINEELIQTMGKLRAAERDGNNALVAEMAQKCQALSVRKAEVGKERRI
jgi:DNA primase